MEDHDASVMEYHEEKLNGEPLGLEVLMSFPRFWVEKVTQPTVFYGDGLIWSSRFKNINTYTFKY